MKGSIIGEILGLICIKSEFAVGQYYVYKKILAKSDPERTLYIALPGFVYDKILTFDWAVEVIEDLKMRFILYETEQKDITTWKE